MAFCVARERSTEIYAGACEARRFLFCNIALQLETCLDLIVIETCINQTLLFWRIHTSPMQSKPIVDAIDWIFARMLLSSALLVFPKMPDLPCADSVLAIPLPSLASLKAHED